ncbi:MAG: hypothetical protein AAF918_13645 [Pseudomonadota bacterium]
MWNTNSIKSTWKNLVEWYRVHILDQCPNPACDGHLEMYDDRPWRDSCHACGAHRYDYDDKNRHLLGNALSSRNRTPGK